MKQATISQQELLSAASRIVAQKGFDGLSIRGLASDCGISVGSIYNYFPSKAELVFALTKEFWDRVLFTAGEELPDHSFLLAVTELHQRLLTGLSSFSKEYLQQMLALSFQDRAKGKAVESNYFEQLKTCLSTALAHDPNVAEGVWGPTFTQQKFLAFIFSSLLTLVRQGKDCDFLQQIIIRTIYQPPTPFTIC